MRIPARIALRMLRGDAGRRSVRPPEDDRAAHLAAGHVKRLGGGVDDLVDGLHREVEGHELDHGAQPSEGRAHTQPGEAVFGNRRVADAPRSELGEQALRHLVGALIFRDFLAHHEDGLVAAHFLGHGVPERLADGDLRRLAPVIDLRRGLRFRYRPAPPRLSRRRRLRDRTGRLRNRDNLRAFAFGIQPQDRGIHLDAFRAFGDDEACDDSFLHRLDFHGRLVGLDFGDHVAGTDPVALGDEPFGERPFRHGRRQCRHGHGDWHRVTPPEGRRCAVRRSRAPGSPRRTARRRRQFP